MFHLKGLALFLEWLALSQPGCPFRRFLDYFFNFLKVEHRFGTVVSLLHNPVHYRSLESYLALPDGTGGFRQDFSGPALLRILHVPGNFWLQGYHLLWPFFPKGSSWYQFLKVVLQPRRSTLPEFRLFPFRSPLLGESLVILFSSCYLDVSVHRVGSLSSDWSSTSRVVPFGNLRVKRLYASNRSLSQLTTSFFAAQCQGIHHTPLFCFKNL